MCARARPPAAGARTWGLAELGRPGGAWQWARLRGGEREGGRQGKQKKGGDEGPRSGLGLAAQPRVP